MSRTHRSFGLLLLAATAQLVRANQQSISQLKNVANEEVIRHWPLLGLASLACLGTAGNLLVCAAVLRERRLQTATNYFLLSLALADLLVCTLVMPFGIIYQFYGFWPYNWRLCNLWVTCDVITCSSSILHMCFISVGRYLGIRNPLHARQANLFVSRRAIICRIGLAWLFATLIASPLAFMDVQEAKSGACEITNKYFLVFGSMLAFFLPMFVMVPSYIMTVRLLSRRAELVRDHALLQSAGTEQVGVVAGWRASLKGQSNQQQGSATPEQSPTRQHEEGVVPAQPAIQSGPTRCSRCGRKRRPRAKRRAHLGRSMGVSRGRMKGIQMPSDLVSVESIQRPNSPSKRSLSHNDSSSLTCYSSEAGQSDWPDRPGSWQGGLAKVCCSFTADQRQLSQIQSPNDKWSSQIHLSQAKPEEGRALARIECSHTHLGSSHSGEKRKWRRTKLELISSKLKWERKAHCGRHRSWRNVPSGCGMDESDTNKGEELQLQLEGSQEQPSDGTAGWPVGVCPQASRWTSLGPQESQSLRQESGGSQHQQSNGKLNSYETNSAQEPQMIRYLGSSMQVRSEQKATKVLGLVFFAFLFCWSPFFLMNFAQGIVDRRQLARYVSNELMTTFLWLGYLSSTINPVIYTVFNRNFRRAFRQLLLCRASNSHFQRERPLNRAFRFGQQFSSSIMFRSTQGSNSWRPQTLAQNSNQQMIQSKAQTQTRNLPALTIFQRPINRQEFSQADVGANQMLNNLTEAHQPQEEPKETLDFRRPQLGLSGQNQAFLRPTHSL